MTTPTQVMALELLDGHKLVRPTGLNIDVDIASVPETIWTPGGLIPYQATAIAIEIVSSSTDDDAAGTGALTVVIEALNSSWEPVTITATMDGTTAVDLTSSGTVFRVNNAYVATAGSGNTNAGNITIRVESAGATLAFIPLITGQMSQATYTIPAAHRGLILSWTSGILVPAASLVAMGLFTRDASVAASVFRLRARQVMAGTGSTNVSDTFSAPILVAAQTDIEVRALSAASDNTSIISSFEVLQVEDIA